MGKTQSYCYYMCEVIKNISDRLHDFFATLFYCSTTPFRYFFISLETVLVFSFVASSLLDAISPWK